MNRVALDTNVLLYLYDFSDNKKRNISESLIAVEPWISAQVISEFLNVTRRVQRKAKTEIMHECVRMLAFCKIISIEQQTMEYASLLVQKHDFQIFDSIIIASALQADCNILYSEDLQHKQIVDKRLTIINPYL